jgi:hypothetical protein
MGNFFRSTFLLIIAAATECFHIGSFLFAFTKIFAGSASIFFIFSFSL